MTWMWVALIIIGVAALAYWQLIIAEGTYLGPRFVAWTYDLVARRYDATKQFVPRDESWFVAGPLLGALGGIESPLVLDVATGTGRLPLALFRDHFQGQVVGLDLSQGMLCQAKANLRLYGSQVCLVWQDAGRLPFGDGMFHAVTCLESLEFMPLPLQVLAEMVRVLAPGGVLLLTNRVGREAHLLPRRAMSRAEFQRALASLPLHEVNVRRWQVQYDLALARKVGRLNTNTHSSGEDLASLVRCPMCGGMLQRGVSRLSCSACQQEYPIREGIVHLSAGVRRSTS
jgi:ubiquinone/menaquinone biosynthesis C-methylase UbiE